MRHGEILHVPWKCILIFSDEQVLLPGDPVLPPSPGTMAFNSFCCPLFPFIAFWKNAAWWDLPARQRMYFNRNKRIFDSDAKCTGRSESKCKISFLHSRHLNFKNHYALFTHFQHENWERAKGSKTVLSPLCEFLLRDLVAVATREEKAEEISGRTSWKVQK